MIRYCFLYARGPRIVGDYGREVCNLTCHTTPFWQQSRLYWRRFVEREVRMVASIATPRRDSRKANETVEHAQSSTQPPCPHKIPVAFGPASRLRHASHSSSHPPNKIRSQWTRKDWIVSGQAMRMQGRRFVTKVDIVGRIPERCATLYELQALRRELKLN
jgi:hypothetical protein